SFESSYDNPLYYAKHLFLNGEEIKELVIPNSIKNINNYLFYNCKGLTSINIPESVTSIGESAFYGCEGLSSIKIPAGIVSLGKSTFYGCEGLTSVNIPESVTSIGDYAFYGCSSLTSVHMPDSLTAIGNYAFNGCWWLKSIKIPKKVTSIGVRAFSYCYNLESIYSFPKIPVACDESIFISDTYKTATLYVPDGSETAYKATSPWNKFNINSIPTSIEGVTSDSNMPEKADIFTIDGKLFKKDFNFNDAANELPANTYIINGKKYLVK
ncbi:MAG: leucine-rich repeat domain-containing protein, partial [Bacteroidaceae bacterium]|nr:leucine-rich repeat domain-containing protein [Bacteroidaceae bacterium]